MDAESVAAENKKFGHFRLENASLIVLLLTYLEIPGLDTFLQVFDRLDSELHDVLRLKHAVLFGHQIFHV